MLVAVDGSPEGYNALIWVLEHITEEGRACALYVISPAKYAAIDGAAGYEGISTLHEIREKLVQDEKEQVTNRIKERHMTGMWILKSSYGPVIREVRYYKPRKKSGQI